MSDSANHRLSPGADARPDETAAAVGSEGVAPVVVAPWAAGNQADTMIEQPPGAAISPEPATPPPLPPLPPQAPVAPVAKAAVDEQVSTFGKGGNRMADGPADARASSAAPPAAEPPATPATDLPAAGHPAGEAPLSAEEFAELLRRDLNNIDQEIRRLQQARTEMVCELASLWGRY